MRIGIPAETLAGEARVAATPETVKKLIAQGHTVVMQADAGLRADAPDADYIAVGATIGDRTEALRNRGSARIGAGLQVRCGQEQP